MLSKDKAKSLVMFVLKESTWTPAFVVSIIMFLLFCMLEYFLFIPLRMGFAHFVINLFQFAIGWFSVETWFSIYDEWCKEYMDYE